MVWFGLVWFLFFFETGFLCADQAGLKLRNPPASASQVLGLQACATTALLSLTPFLTPENFLVERFMKYGNLEPSFRQDSDK